MHARDYWAGQLSAMRPGDVQQLSPAACDVLLHEGLLLDAKAVAAIGDNVAAKRQALLDGRDELAAADRRAMQELLLRTQTELAVARESDAARSGGRNGRVIVPVALAVILSAMFVVVGSRAGSLTLAAAPAPTSAMPSHAPALPGPAPSPAPRTVPPAVRALFERTREAGVLPEVKRHVRDARIARPTKSPAGSAAVADPDTAIPVPRVEGDASPVLSPVAWFAWWDRPGVPPCRATDFDGPTRLPPLPELDGVSNRSLLFPPQRDASTQVRFLGAFQIDRGFSGFSNILMSLYGLAMMGVMSDRVVIIPDTPPDCAPIAALIDIPRLREAFKDIGVAFVTRDEVPALVARGVLPPHTAVFRPGATPPRVSARACDMKWFYEWGPRERQAFNADTQRAIRQQRRAALLAHDHQHIVVDNGFCAFPWTLHSPFGHHFFLRHAAYHPRIRRLAAELMAAMRTRRNVTRLLAVHLRLEVDNPDAFYGGRTTAADVTRLFQQIAVVAERSGCDGIYIAAGDIAPELESAVRDFAAVVPVMFKKDFPEVKISTATHRSAAAPVTSAEAAGVDALILSHSSVFVGTTQYTSLLSTVMAVRCRPTPGLTNLTAARFRAVFGAAAPSTIVDPPPGAGLAPNASSPPPLGLHQRRRYRYDSYMFHRERDRPGFLPGGHLMCPSD
jgi:hypothetical protein